MKTAILILLSLAFTSISTAQIGIGTNTPDNSAMLEVVSTSKGFLLPKMTSPQREGIASPASGLQVYDLTTKSIWYHNGSFWVNTLAMASNGDIKSGIQAADHSGWVLLNGRLLSTLSVNQQAIATSLGFSGNLPNATNTYLSQAGGTLGAVAGANTVVLTQANLPSVNFTGTAALGGGHEHTVDPAPFWTSSGGSHTHGTNTDSNRGLAVRDCNNTTTALDNGQCNELNLTTIGGLSVNSTGSDHQHNIDVPNTTSSFFNDHTHPVTVASGGSATPVNIAPRTLSVNMFIYLGL
jgi:hypothetical protein